jgi:hypothetical protein
MMGPIQVLVQVVVVVVVVVSVFVLISSQRKSFQQFPQHCVLS